MNGKQMPWEAYPHIWKTESSFMSWLQKELGTVLLGTDSEIPNSLDSFDNLDKFIYQCAEVFAKNGGGRKFLRDPERCYLYWIRLPEHSDITKEGYVGITNNFEYRMYQHKTLNRNSYLSNNLDKSICSIILIGEKSYCREIESKLRPLPHIGWNRAVGGDGGTPKHSLTGTKIAKTFYNLRTKSLKEGKEFLPEYDSTTEGLVAFSKLYKELEHTEGCFMIDSYATVITLDKIYKVPVKESRRKGKRKYVIDGEYCSIVEIAEKYGVSGNKISCRLRDGWEMSEIIKWLKNL
jgi:predicted GIY-YIG superfamily endonuclease